MLGTRVPQKHLGFLLPWPRDLFKKLVCIAGFLGKWVEQGCFSLVFNVFTVKTIWEGQENVPADKSQILTQLYTGLEASQESYLKLFNFS